ncbi:MAG: glycosyltransferase [Ardenticatenaceae bacterium]|nr:glycosyltransferase [Ardenticatenaceae bacterium]MCB8987050.1 glycosyltransferase [Ardenticatenaceae bacterium]
MKILHVYKDYSPIRGGIENHIKTLAEAQAAAGHQVTVLVTNPGGEKPDVLLNGVRVVRAARLATIASTPISLTLPRLLRRLDADIVHLQFPYPLGELSQWLVGGKRPFLISYQSDVVKQQAILRLYDPLLRRILRRASRILASSPNYIDSSPYLRPLADHCTIVPLGIDPQPFLQVAPLTLPPSDLPTLLFVGRHRYYKGVDTLIRAMPDIAARLLIAGDGPMRPAWEALAAELDLGERVTFLGDIGDVDLPRLYAAADVFVLPSNVRAEAFGLVLLEAMASGLPCVTTEVGTGTSFVVQDGQTGLVVPPQDEGALATAVSHLLQHPDLRRQMGQNGRARLLAEFTTPKMVARVEAVYRQLLSGGN